MMISDIISVVRWQFGSTGLVVQKRLPTVQRGPLVTVDKVSGHPLNESAKYIQNSYINIDVIAYAKAENVPPGTHEFKPGIIFANFNASDHPKDAEKETFQG